MIAAASRFQEHSTEGGITATKIQDSRISDVSEYVKQRRFLHDDVRVGAPFTVGRVTREDGFVIVERPAV